MSNKEVLKDFYGRILGTKETKLNGDIVAKNFYGKIVGVYHKNQNVTKDFYGRIIGVGDLTSSLIFSYNK